MFRRSLACAVAAPALLALAPTTDVAAQPSDAPPAAASSGRHAVYTLTNEADGNRLAVFPRQGNGALAAPMFVATGGLGSGDGLGNQGAIDLDGFVIYAVNAGSNTISVMLDLPLVGPLPIQQVDAGGERPVSLDVEGDRLYVVNAGGAVGGADSVAGFDVGPLGMLTPIAGSVRPLSADSTAPAQIAFSADRAHLIVTEKATNTITTFAIAADGSLSDPMPQPSVGETPFGFMVDPSGHVVVSEAFGGAANASAVSTYAIDGDGQLSVITASAPTTETAACWVALTANGRYAYTTNTADSTVTGFALDQSGAAWILDDDGETGFAGDGAAPTDAIVLGNRVLYVLNGNLGEVVGFRILPGGALLPLAGAAGVPGAPTGLVAR